MCHPARVRGIVGYSSDGAAFDGEQIPSAAVVAETSFDCEEDRAAFMDDYVRAVAERSARAKMSPVAMAVTGELGLGPQVD